MTDHIRSSGVHLGFSFKRLANTFFNFVFPPVCAHCKKTGELLCVDCLASVPWINEPVCTHCGRIVNRPMARCSACRHHPLFPLQQVRAAVQFTNPIPDMIYQMKYNGLFALAEPLADLMADAWAQWQMPIDLVLGVPLHPDREKKRGYNQSDLLAHHFCKRLDLVENRQALQRMRNTPPQVGLDSNDRRTNVANAFQADRATVSGKNILLVDDVCTTGSTLMAASEALLAVGAHRVFGYCLARAL